MAELTSETWCQLAIIGALVHRAVFYRTGIRAILAEINKTVLFGLWALLGAHALERTGKRCCEPSRGQDRGQIERS